MDVRTFESIKTKIETLKTDKAKSEGAIEAITESWKKDYGFSTLEEAEAKRDKMDEEIKGFEETIEELFTELKGLTNWAAV